MYNFCDICLIYKLMKKFEKYQKQETIDLCEAQIPMTYFVCLNSCEFCNINRRTLNWKITKWFNLIFSCWQTITSPWSSDETVKLVIFVQLYQRYFLLPRTVVLAVRNLYLLRLTGGSLLSTVCLKVNCVDAHSGLSDFWRIKVKGLGLAKNLAIATCCSPPYFVRILKKS